MKFDCGKYLHEVKKCEIDKNSQDTKRARNADLFYSSIFDTTNSCTFASRQKVMNIIHKSTPFKNPHSWLILGVARPFLPHGSIVTQSFVRSSPLIVHQPRTLLSYQTPNQKQIGFVIFRRTIPVSL